MSAAPQPSRTLSSPGGARPLTSSDEYDIVESTAPFELTGTPSRESASTRPPRVNTRKADFIEEDYFGPQPTSSTSLSNPRPLAENLARACLEILSGARDLDQISRWVTDEVYRALLTRVHVSSRARAIKNIPAHRPMFSVGSTTVCEPSDGVAECCVILHGKARSRSVAIRLEGLDGRWRATAIHVL